MLLIIIKIIQTCLKNSRKENIMELNVDSQIINYMKIENEDYISITDMLKSKDGNFFCY